MRAASGNSETKIRVAYVDDQLLFREALVSALEDSGAVSVIRSSRHGDADLRALLDAPVQVVLMSLDGQATDPMATVRESHQLVPELPICALVAIDRLERTREALAAGCKGAVSTAATLSMLISALENLARGQAFVDPTLGGRLLARTVLRSLGSREGANGSQSSLASRIAEVKKS